VALGVLAAALALVVVTGLMAPMKDDIAWLLYVAEQWLKGRQLYVDLVEVNPPLIVWLSAVPVALADMLRLPAKLVALPMFVALVLGCAWWASGLARRATPPFDDRLTLFAVIGAVLLLIPGGEFGQREHLLIAASLPYLALVAFELGGRRAGRRTAVVAGLLAALGCALKPRFVFAFGLVELVALWQVWRGGARTEWCGGARTEWRGAGTERQAVWRPVGWLLRPATLAASATLGVYGVAVLVLEPAFLREAVPMAFALYGGTDAPFGDLLFDCRVMLFAVAVGLVLLTTERVRDEDRGQVIVLLAFAAGAAMVCFIEGKNWFYHRIPAIVAALLALFAWAAPRLRRGWLQPQGSVSVGARRAVPVLLAALAVSAASLSAYERLRPRLDLALERQSTIEQKLEDLLRHEHATSYLALSEWMALGFPVVNSTGVAWGSRFDSMWALRGELWRTAQDGRPPADWPVGRWVAQDFRAACPDIVVVDRRSPAIDYVDILSRADREFSRIWSMYQRIATFNGIQVFRRSRPAQPFACGPVSTALKSGN
jgi:hypothetical protein